MKKQIIYLSVLLISIITHGIDNYNTFDLKKLSEKNILEKVDDKEIISVIITLDMEYKSQNKNKLTEIERQKAISELQKEFIKSFEGMNVSLRKKGRITPWVSMTVDKETLKYLTKIPIVKKISLNKPLFTQLFESTSIIEANTVWDNMGITGEGQTIVILDTGVDYEHEFFSDRVVTGACFSTNDQNLYNSTSLCPNGEEEQYGIIAGRNCYNIFGCDHGTHVAGIAAGSITNFSGLAPASNIISVQVFTQIKDATLCGANDSCIIAWTEDIIEALEWVYDIRKDYSIASVNMSLGGGEFSSPCNNDPMKPIIDSLIDKGIAIIASSGNNYFDNAMVTPACIPSVISVGATNKDDIHSSSSNAAPFLDLTAPGSSIYSSILGDEYASYSVTSMAAPHVAGTVALMKSASPDLTFTEIRNHLHNSADKVDGMGEQDFTNEYGYGRLNAFEALLEVCSPFYFENKLVRRNRTINHCHTVLRNVTVGFSNRTPTLTINSEKAILEDNVTVEDGAKLIINANDVQINKNFEAQMGSELVIE